MRDIKFRAWDDMQKVMHNNFQFIKSGDDGMIGFYLLQISNLYLIMMGGLKILIFHNS